MQACIKYFQTSEKVKLASTIIMSEYGDFGLTLTSLNLDITVAHAHFFLAKMNPALSYMHNV